MTTKQFNDSVTDSIKNLVNKAKQGAIPDSFEDWLKSNGDDIGGNEIPDRVAANHERYTQQGEKERHPFV